MTVVRLVAGPIFTAMSGFAILYLYAFASMVDPSLDEWSRRSEIFWKMVDNGAWLPVLVLCFGLWLTVTGFANAIRGKW